MKEFVEICKETFRTDNFQVTTPFPPTQIPDGKFNYIVGYSVFSYLSEDACARWMMEFNRILAPGGAHIFTVPIINKERESECWASRDENGETVYHHDPEYHGNPIDNEG